MLERGRATSTLAVVLDARDGLRANITGEMEDVALTRPGERDPVLVVPKATVHLSDFLYRDDKVAVGRFELAGSANVLEPGAGAGDGTTCRPSARASLTSLGRSRCRAGSTSRARCRAAGSLRPHRHPPPATRGEPVEAAARERRLGAMGPPAAG